MIHNEDGTYRMVRPPLRARFNPLDMVRSAKSPVGVAKMLAASLIIPDGSRPHWGNGARSLLGAFMCFTALQPGYRFDRNLGSVWEDLNQRNSPSRNGDDILEGEFSAFLRDMSNTTIANGYPAREASRFIDGAHDEVRSIRQTTFTNCGSILDDPEIVEAMSESSLDLADIQREPTTIYLCLPGYLMDSHSRWFRLMLACILAAVERSGLREPDSNAPRTLWLLNEFASQQKNDVMLEALPRMRGHGQQFWIFVQDLNQLRYWYKDAWETFVSNTGVVQAFGGSPDMFTAEYLSKQTGQQTITKVGKNESDKGGGSTSYNAGGRPLKYPHEIMALNAGPDNKLKQLLIFSGEGSVVADRLLYYRDLPPRKSGSGPRSASA